MIFSLLLFGSIAAVSAVPAKLYCYWDTWSMWNHAQYVNDLIEVPILQGSTKGCNIVIMAFSQYSITTDTSSNPLFGYLNSQTASDYLTFDHDHLKAAVDAVKAKGGEVWVSLGGSGLFLSTYISTTAAADAFAIKLSDAVTHYGITGIDLSHQYSGDTAVLMGRIIQKLKDLRTATPALNYKVMYTIPAKATALEPWKTVLASHANLDAVQILDYDYYDPTYLLSDDLTRLTTLGVPNSKVVVGIMPGCHDDINEAHLTVQGAKLIAKLVKNTPYNGVGIWSANRDALTRPPYTSIADPEQCKYFTGLADGTYMVAVSTKLT
jgi:chitinase